MSSDSPSLCFLLGGWAASKPSHVMAFSISTLHSCFHWGLVWAPGILVGQHGREPARLAMSSLNSLLMGMAHGIISLMTSLSQCVLVVVQHGAGVSMDWRFRSDDRASGGAGDSTLRFIAAYNLLMPCDYGQCHQGAAILGAFGQHPMNWFLRC